MVDSRVHSGANRAGIVSKIRLENFMCHSNLEIQLGDFLNFVTGQNGSGKSAILTALCVAFGCRARGTQRASSLKDFIKTGCSYALVHVELKNKGEDAFKPETYGDNIIIERRISEATSSTILKDHQGKRVASRKEDLIDIVEHFNIDVENPCVIMSQDKSREFLHSGNAKDKFKFFFKATLLHHVDDLLKSIEKQLNGAQELVGNLENSIRPILKELSELQGKIKSMEQFEEISQRVQLLKKKLAWAHVYDIDDQIQQAEARIEKLKGRIPHCEDLIARQTVKMEGLEDRLAKKKAQIAILMERTSEVRKMKEELQHNRSEATKERSELEQDCIRRVNEIKRIMKRAEMLEQQIRDISDQDDKHTQAEEHEMEENLSELKKEVEEAVLQFERFSRHSAQTTLLHEQVAYAVLTMIILKVLKKMRYVYRKKFSKGKKRYLEEAHCNLRENFQLAKMDYIHTSDPNFIGGSKTVELAVQEMKSLRAADSTIARHEDGSEKAPSSERSLKSRAILSRQANGIILQQGARPATESTAPGSTTGSSWGISSIFGGSDNRVAAKENLTSKPSNEPIQTIEPSSSMIHLGETLDELPVDADAVERGYSLNAEPTGLPRIHGLPSYSFDSNRILHSFSEEPKVL